MTEGIMKSAKQHMEKKLREIRREIDFYETQRRKLSGISGKFEEKSKYIHKKLKELWVEFWSVYSRLKTESMNPKE